MIATAERPQLPVLFPILLLIALALAAAAVALNAHALERHGSEAESVAQCVSGGGEIQRWMEPGGRIARVCQIDPGLFGVLIETADGQNVTAFIKNKMRTLGQVEQYLKNQGARLIWAK